MNVRIFSLVVLSLAVVPGCGDDVVPVPNKDLASSPPGDAALNKPDLAEPIVLDLAKNPDMSKPPDLAGRFLVGLRQSLIASFDNLFMGSTGQMYDVQRQVGFQKFRSYHPHQVI